MPEQGDIVRIPIPCTSVEIRVLQGWIQRSLERGVTEEEVVEAILNGEIIEEYPTDKYGSSCLILGRTKAGRALHVQCSLPPTVWVITLYEPDPEEWSDLRTRKR